MTESTILLIGNDKTLADQVQKICEPIADLSSIALNGIDAAYNYESWENVSLVLIHQSNQGSAMQVNRLLRMIAAAQRPVATIVLAEPYDNDQYNTLMQMGVADYLGLPLDKTRLAYLIEVLTIRHRRVSLVTAPEVNLVERVAENVPVKAAKAFAAATIVAAAASRADQILLDGETPQVITLVEQIRRVAPHSATILLGGETGTGKTRLARQIHELSDRRDEPFLTVNCGTLSSSLIEGELFGHVRGAFDGAEVDRTGKFADVGRGTLFLDGIDALPPAVQTKLLRVVEDRSFEPIGATGTLPLQARLIAASNRPLDEEVAERRFRSDLYYRLNVVGFQLPPLRDRRDAIIKLVQRFLSELTDDSKPVADRISDDAMQALQEHDWPGNVRELKNVIQRCLVINPDRTIRREDLPMSVLDGVSRISTSTTQIHPILAATFNRSSLAQTKGQAELARITEALEKHGNNRLRAAAELKISRMTLYKKLYKYGLMQPTSSQLGRAN